MRLHGHAIYACTQSVFTAPPDVRYTQNGDRLYVHIYAWPFRHLHLPGLAGKVAYAQLLNDGSEIPIQEGGALGHWGADAPTDVLTLNLPVVKPDVVVPVVELFLK
jgi:alpha-L-fucosidase